MLGKRPMMVEKNWQLQYSTEHAGADNIGVTNTIFGIEVWGFNSCVPFYGMRHNDC